jgi:signal transduction histidine kinase
LLTGESRASASASRTGSDARSIRAALIAAGGLAAILLTVVGLNTRRWVDTTFPGFFVMSNRVVPSIVPLGESTDASPSRFFQHQVLAVDGKPVATAHDVYDLVRARPPGTPVRYTFRAPQGFDLTVALPARVFTRGNYVLLFGAFLVCGASFIAIGLLVAFLKPHSAASYGLLSAGVTAGLFVSTAADLYGPHWFARFHIACEAMLAPAFFHLALVFPTERVKRHRRWVLTAIYLAFVPMALLYELVLDLPAAYTTVHLLATATHGLGAAGIIGAVTYDFFTSGSPLVRRRVGIVALGTLAAFSVPLLSMAASAFLGGTVPLNAGALTAVVFPLSIGYAIVKEDLLEIDVMLRRATSYGIVVLSIAIFYLAALSILGFMIPGTIATESPLTLAILNLALLFLIAPIKTRVQNAVDHVFFRKGYDAEGVLSELGHTFASAHTIFEVVGHTCRILDSALRPLSAAIYWWERGGTLQPLGDQPSAGPTVGLPADLARRIEEGELLTRYEWDEGTGREMPAVWQALDAHLLVPIGSGGSTRAVLALGAKGSGRSYHMDDIVFLRAAASQVALALANARAFAQLEELNASLEEMVVERTGALANANTELNRSLEDTRGAYRQLELSQKSLMRADRLATLGRLAAGIAHEVNTPLGATLNSLALISDLSREYAESIDDGAVTKDDHRAIARDLTETSEAAMNWARKAAAYIAKVKMHGRDSRSTSTASFRVAGVITEAGALLAHRLRAATCQLDFAEDGAASVVGDAQHLGQVVVNLVTNAIDAYEERGVFDGRIEIRVRTAESGVLLTVRDWAGGIPEHVLPNIFDELFTTKEPGKGTGLGLWIARNLVEQSFAGSLTVESEVGVGSCFSVILPAASAAAAGPSGSSDRPLPGAPPTM